MALRRQRRPERGDCGALCKRERLWETQTAGERCQAGENDRVATRSTTPSSSGELFLLTGGDQQALGSTMEAMSVDTPRWLSRLHEARRGTACTDGSRDGARGRASFDGSLCERSMDGALTDGGSMDGTLCGGGCKDMSL